MSKLLMGLAVGIVVLGASNPTAAFGKDGCGYATAGKGECCAPKKKKHHGWCHEPPIAQVFEYAAIERVPAPQARTRFRMERESGDLPEKESSCGGSNELLLGKLAEVAARLEKLQLQLEKVVVTLDKHVRRSTN